MVWRMLYDCDIAEPFCLIDYVQGEELCLIDVEKDPNLPQVIKLSEDGGPWGTYSFHGLRKDRNYMLSLTLRDGLSQVVDSTLTHQLSRTARVIEHRVNKRVGIGTFDDFKAIGTYADKRFLFVLNDLEESPLSTSTDFPPELRNELTRTLLQNQDNSDFHVFQSDVCRTFYRYFCSALEKCTGISHQQLDELRQLVSPLDSPDT